MAGAHQYLNGSCDLTTPFSSMICSPWASIITVNLLKKFEVANSTHYEGTKSDKKCQNGGGLGVIVVTQGH